jgi:hypothetical protein
MATILYKWLFVVTMISNLSFMHPIFVSVTEIEHNAKEKTLEISCKVFTDDFEKALRKTYNTPIDLVAPKNKAAINTIVADYVSKHIAINIDDKKATLNYIGYEQIEEGIYCYFQANNISVVKKISIIDNVMYDYKKEQVSVLHVTVGGVRQSTKINNPVDKVEFVF